MLLSGLLVNIILQLAVWLPSGNALASDRFYRTDSESEILINGVDKFKQVKLRTPIYLYSSTYDHVYVRCWFVFYGGMMEYFGEINGF